MTTQFSTPPVQLAHRHPSISASEIVSSLTPPPQFNTATFDSYRPDPNYPSQEFARETLRAFATTSTALSNGAARGSIFGRRKAVVDERPVVKQGIYLDGGFGVGKTHLLAALWHATAGRKYFGTFIEFTALVGALGYQAAVQALTGAKLICIDEFELDDPGDTMIMTRLIGDLAATGCKFAATSNTPPNALGEGRFAAEDFLREIQAMSDRFTTIRIDGEDYRHRDVTGHAPTVSTEELQAVVSQLLTDGKSVAVDDFGSLITHLGALHPSTYIRLIEGIDRLALSDCYLLTSQTDALRFVAFIDRVYDAQIGIVSTGLSLDQIFSDEMLDGGYRKKYLRCMSRLVALTTGEL
jgi:cell division protein ZapE